jgi:hypothetical protein
MPKPCAAHLPSAESQGNGKAIRVHPIEQAPAAVLHADDGLAILREAQATIEEARIEVVVADQCWTSLRPSHLRAAGHIRRRAPHAQETRCDIILLRDAAEGVVDRDQLRHVQLQQTATCHEVRALVQALALIPDLEQRPRAIEEGLPAVAGPGLFYQLEVYVHGSLPQRARRAQRMRMPRDHGLTDRGRRAQRVECHASSAEH